MKKLISASLIATSTMNFDTSRMSRRALLQLAAGASAAAIAPATGSRFSPSLAQAAQSTPMFHNPLFAGDYADPSILRVGSDFYATHTSYRYTPGLLVWHSRDLVNWAHVSSALPRIHGEGEVWAPDLVEHQGRYFIYYPQNGRLFVVHTLDPRGPWSEPVDLKVGGIDPGHVVGSDGTRYLHENRSGCPAACGGEERAQWRSH